MASYTPLAAATEAIYGVLRQDATLIALVAGGVQTDVPENPAFDFLWIEVDETAQHGGFGTKPGVGALPELRVRLHVFSPYQGEANLHAVIARAIQLIADPPAVTGYSSWAIFHETTQVFPDQILNGVKVKELVSEHRLLVEEQ